MFCYKKNLIYNRCKNDLMKLMKYNKVGKCGIKIGLILIFCVLVDNCNIDNIGD